MPTGTAKTWASGDALTAALANAELRDQFIAQFGVPTGRLYFLSGGSVGGGIVIPTQSAATIATTVAAGNLITFDGRLTNAYTGAMTTGASRWSRLIAPIDGIYALEGLCNFIQWGGPGGTPGAALLKLNGTNLVDVQTFDPGNVGGGAGPIGSVVNQPGDFMGGMCPSPTVGTDIKMHAADYIELYGTESIPSTTGYVTGQSCLSLTWRGNYA